MQRQTSRMKNLMVYLKGSVLSPLLVLIHRNYNSDTILCKSHLYADGTVIAKKQWCCMSAELRHAVTYNIDFDLDNKQIILTLILINQGIYSLHQRLPHRLESGGGDKGKIITHA